MQTPQIAAAVSYINMATILVQARLLCKQIQENKGALFYSV